MSTDGAVNEALAELKAAFLSQCGQVNREITDFMARALLLSARTERERVRLCRELSFNVSPPEKTALGPNELIAWIGFMFFMLLCSFLMFGALFNVDISIRFVLFLAAMVAASYGSAAFCGLALKGIFAGTRPSDDSRPFAGYLVAALSAGLLAGAITLVLKTLYHLDFWKAALEFEFSYPWLIMSCVTALVVAILADGYRAGQEPFWARWLDAVILALALVAASYVVCAIFQEIANWPANKPRPDFRYVACVNGFVGFAMGALIPQWHRARASRTGASPMTLRPPQMVPAG